MMVNSRVVDRISDLGRCHGLDVELGPNRSRSVFWYWRTRDGAAATRSGPQPGRTRKFHRAHGGAARSTAGGHAGPGAGPPVVGSIHAVAP